MARANAQAAVATRFIEGIERRDSPRAELLVRVNYQTVDALFSEFARNINEGGMFIETEDPQPVGTRVELEFQLPGGEDPLTVTGFVVRCDEAGSSFGMGIEFDSLAETERDQINQIVRKLRPPAQPRV